MRSGGIRGRLVLVVMGVVGIGLVLLVLAFNLILSDRLDSDIDAVLTARANGQLSSLDVRNGKLIVTDVPDEATAESQAWIYAGKRVLAAPRSARHRVNSAANALATGRRRYQDVESPAVRLLAQPVVDEGKRVGTVVVAASRTPYESTRDTALVASVVLAVVLILVLGLVARLLLDAALRPVARMTASAAEWSETDLDRRFNLGPPSDELTRLAATLDGLLDRLAAGMRREQRLSAELSHELRTPLAKISTQAQLLASSPDLEAEQHEEAEAILRAGEEMREVIDVLMASARAEAGVVGRDTADVADAARASLEAARPEAEERGVAFEVVADANGGSGAVRATAEPKLVERILAPLVENATRHARSRAVVRVARNGQWVEVAVEDDGPGVPPGQEATVFEPGFRGGGADDDNHGGAGLGLSLSRRLARSAGGDVEADARASGGRFVVRLPAA
jgi:signal transduction histidine kinase